MHTLIPALVEQIAPFTNEPYVLCGHSLGGLVAFELALALRARGLGPPRALVVCGVRAPHHRPDDPLLHPLPTVEFVHGVERRYGALPPEIRACTEILEFLLPVLRADLEVYETYVHVPVAPLNVPLLALGGETDANVSRQQVLDWRAYTTGAFEAAMIPGGHFFPQENLSRTIDWIQDFLQRSARHLPGNHPQTQAPRPE